MPRSCWPTGKGKRLLIAGADPSVRKDDLIDGLAASAACSTAASTSAAESVDTRSNAEEAKRWLDRRKYQVACGWSPATGTCAAPRYEFRQALGGDYRDRARRGADRAAAS